MPKLPKARLKNIVVQDFATEILIYDLISNKALCLNETSRIVWQARDGKTTFEELRQKTNLQFSDEWIWFALDQLKRDNLLDKNTEIAVNFEGLSRREAVRKIGFAGVVVLPVISSIVAPSSAAAQSGGVCSVPADCSDGNDCTIDACSSGVCSHTPAPAGTVCSNGGFPGFCNSTGVCVS